MGVSDGAGTGLAVDGQVEGNLRGGFAHSFDHRVVDGAVGARFTNRLIDYLTEPGKLFLELA